MRIDYLIIYEHVNRELENACLLAAELEHRGYTVAIECIYSIRKYFIKPKVIIVPHLYNDNQLISFCKNIWCSNTAILDLQYEQVLSKAGKGGIHTPRGQAKFAQHIAWGQAQVEEYLNGDINPKNIHITGHMQMDLKNNIFNSFHIHRKDIAKEFNLDLSKKWVMFLSTFSYTGMSEKKINQFEKSLNPDARRFAKISEESRNTILDWFEKEINNYPKVEFIYRPHPAEKNFVKVIEMSKKYSNFKCIDKYSLDQWIDSADFFYNWYSTSIADVYYKNKPCFVLRPVRMYSDLEVGTLEGAKTITSLKDFEISLNALNDNPSKIEFPVKKELFEYYYGFVNDKGKFAFQKIADLCEKMIVNSNMHYNYNYGRRGFNFVNSKRIRGVIGTLFFYLLFEITSIFRMDYLKRINSNNEYLRLLKVYSSESYGVRNQIRLLIKKFTEILNKLYESK